MCAPCHFAAAFTISSKGCCFLPFPLVNDLAWPKVPAVPQGRARPAPWLGYPFVPVKPVWRLSVRLTGFVVIWLCLGWQLMSQFRPRQRSRSAPPADHLGAVGTLSASYIVDRIAGSMLPGSALPPVGQPLVLTVSGSSPSGWHRPFR